MLWLEERGGSPRDPFFDMDYDSWIVSFLEEHNPNGLCKLAVDQMSEEFPELRKVRGHVHCSWGKRAHWWLEDPEGNIVDPTASQFPLISRYEHWDSSKELKLGKCLNCGEIIWGKVNEGPQQFCSPECRTLLAEDLVSTKWNT